MYTEICQKMFICQIVILLSPLHFYFQIVNVRLGILKREIMAKSKLGKRKREVVEVVKKDDETEPLPAVRSSDEPVPKKVRQA